jgi:hypothetical protein
MKYRNRFAIVPHSFVVGDFTLGTWMISNAFTGTFENRRRVIWPLNRKKGAVIVELKDGQVNWMNPFDIRIPKYVRDYMTEFLLS